jgi:hypothetical protein
MAERKLTLWKLQVLVGVFALVFALCFSLLGSAVGLAVIIMSLPLWSAAFLTMLSERLSERLVTVISVSFVLFLFLCQADRLTRAVFGIAPSRWQQKRLLIWALLYYIAGLSVGHSVLIRADHFAAIDRAELAPGQWG